MSIFRRFLLRSLFRRLDSVNVTSVVSPSFVYQSRGDFDFELCINFNRFGKPLLLCKTDNSEFAVLSNGTNDLRCKVSSGEFRYFTTPDARGKKLSIVKQGHTVYVNGQVAFQDVTFGSGTFSIFGIDDSHCFKGKFYSLSIFEGGRLACKYVPYRVPGITFTNGLMEEVSQTFTAVKSFK